MNTRPIEPIEIEEFPSPRETACEWHGGGGSALYAYCSTGTIVDGLREEVQENIDWCLGFPDTDEAGDLLNLQQLLDVVTEE
jgi:hypothetical protein